MLPETPLDIFRGDVKQFRITVTKDDDGVISPMDISGLSIKFTVKALLADPDPGIFQKTTAAGGVVITDGPAGKAIVTVQAADTDSQPAEMLIFRWDAQVTSGAGPITVAKGPFRIVPDVTRTP